MAGEEADAGADRRSRDPAAEREGCRAKGGGKWEEREGKDKVARSKNGRRRCRWRWWWWWRREEEETRRGLEEVRESCWRSPRPAAAANAMDGEWKKAVGKQWQLARLSCGGFVCCF